MPPALPHVKSGKLRALAVASAKRLDRFEVDEMALQEARRDIFLEIAAREPGRCVVIDATAGEASVAAAIRDAVMARLDPLAARQA